MNFSKALGGHPFSFALFIYSNHIYQSTYRPPEILSNNQYDTRQPREMFLIVSSAGITPGQTPISRATTNHRRGTNRPASHNKLTNEDTPLPLITNTYLVGSAERDLAGRRRADLNKEPTTAYIFTTSPQPFAIGQQGLFWLIAAI